MPDLVDRLGAALLDAGLAAAAISGLVILAMIQSRQPSRRRSWARAGLLAALSLLPLSALNPVPRLDLWRPILDVWPATLDEPGPRPSARSDPDRPGCGPAHAPAGRLRQAGRVAVLAYGVGASLGLGWVALGLWGSTWLAGRARAPSAGALARLASLPFAGGRGRPGLLVSDRPSRPVLVGFFRPTILIPAEFDRPESADRLRLGLLHELAHAESADHLFGPAAALARAIWFFLPPVWWICDRLRLDSEFLADSRAAAHFGASGRYASSLVDLASSRGLPPAGPIEAAPGPPAGARAGGDGGGTSALFHRVAMLLRCPFPIEDRPPGWWRWASSTMIVAATLAASCLTLRGIAGWSEGATPRAMEPARSFRLPALVIDPAEGEDAPFDLRVRLPDRFTLSLEILAGPAELGAIEILGHRLGPAPAPADDSGGGGPGAWHRVELRRAGAVEDVRVDGRPVGDGAIPRKPASWLAIRPAPGRAARIRGLDLSW